MFMCLKTKVLVYFRHLKMAGRGRSKTTLSREQLQALNIKGNDCLPVNLEPPPTFPPLMTKPSPFLEHKKYVARAERSYKFKKDMFKKHCLNESKENILKAKSMMDYENDNDIIIEFKKRRILFIKAGRWDRMPAELLLQGTTAHKRIRKSEKDIPDIGKRLDELAAKENSSEIAADTEDKSVESDKDAEDDDEINEEPEDEEFDDDNDYGNNYFDNGEAYDDNAEEPLDDGPIY